MLFFVAYEHAHQGQGFFAALRDFASRCTDHRRALSILCENARVRRFRINQSKRPGVDREAIGFILSDIPGDDDPVPPCNPSGRPSPTSASPPKSKNTELAQQVERDEDATTKEKVADVDRGASVNSASTPQSPAPSPTLPLSSPEAARARPADRSGLPSPEPSVRDQNETSDAAAVISPSLLVFSAANSVADDSIGQPNDQLVEPSHDDGSQIDNDDDPVAVVWHSSPGPFFQLHPSDFSGPESVADDPSHLQPSEKPANQWSEEGSRLDDDDDDGGGDGNPAVASPEHSSLEPPVGLPSQDKQHSTQEDPSFSGESHGSFLYFKVAKDQDSTKDRAKRGEAQGIFHHDPHASTMALQNEKKRSLDNALKDQEDLVKHDTLVQGDWLNAALGDVCNIKPLGVALIDSTVTKSPPKRRAAECVWGRGNSTTTLLLLSLSGNHWAIAVVKHGPVAATAVYYYDSLPTETNAKEAQDHVDAFLQGYLPETPSSASVLVPCSSPSQTNGIDCGVFAFASGLHIVTGQPLPAKLHVGLWRRIMASLLGVAVDDWQSLIPDCQEIPVPTPPRQRPIDPPPEKPSDRAEQFRLFAESTKEIAEWHRKAEGMMLRHLERQTADARNILTSVRTAASIARQISKATEAHVEETEAEMMLAKRVGALGPDTPHGATSTAKSMPRITSDLAKAQKILKQITVVLDELQRLEESLGVCRT